MNKIWVVSLTILSVMSFRVFANQKTDSLLKELSDYKIRKIELNRSFPVKADSAYVLILLRLADAYLYNDSSKSFGYAREARYISEQISFERGIAGSMRITGILIHKIRGDFPAAIDTLEKALEIYVRTNNKKKQAQLIIDISLAYFDLGKYKDAVDGYFKALKIAEAIHDTNSIGSALSNIASTYLNLREFEKAENYYSDGIRLFKSIGEEKNLIFAYSNLGLVKMELGKYDEANELFQKVLKYATEKNDKQVESVTIGNLGKLSFLNNKLDEALTYMFKSLELKNETGDLNGRALAYSNIGGVYLELKQYGHAEKYSLLGLEIAKQTGNLQRACSIYENLYLIDSSRATAPGITIQDKYRFTASALNYFRFTKIYQDSVFNKDIAAKAAELQMQYDFEKKEVLAKAEQEKQKELALRERQKERLVRNSLISGISLSTLFAAIVYRQRRKIKIEKNKSERLLLNILPEQVAQELKSTGTSTAKSYASATVMFTDFVDFTKISTRISSEHLVGEIHHCYSAFDAIIRKHNIEKIKTIGDAYMCASGLPVANNTHAIDMIKAAVDIIKFMENRKKEKTTKGEDSFDLRIGIHTGSVVAGVVGTDKYAYDIWGDTVNIAWRLQENSEPGKINISTVTFDMVKENFTGESRGTINVKNRGEMGMWYVYS